MRITTLILLLTIPVFASAQTTDSIRIVRQLDSLLRLVRPLIDQQKLDEALRVVHIVQEKTDSTFGENHPAYATCLALRGKIAQKKEKYKEAEAWYLKAMALQEKLFGKESQQYTISLSTLSTIYLVMGEYGKAGPLILETLNIREKLVGKQHPDYARALGTLGSLNFHNGYYGKAELLYLEALSVFKNTLGKKHPEYSFVLGNLANVYSETGNYAKAVPLMLEVREIIADTYGNKHPFYIKTLLDLAAYYSELGDVSKAESLYVEAIDLFSSGINKESAGYAIALGKLGSIYLDRGDLVRAEPLDVKAAEVCAKIFGKQHPDYALTLKNLALLYAAKGDYVRADSLFLKAHEINKKTLSKDHPNTAQTAGLLALYYQQTNRSQESGARFLESMALTRRNIERAAGYSSESEMLRYLQKFQQNTTQFYSFAQSHPSPEIAGASFDEALFYKGFLLNAAIQVRNRAYSDTAAALKFGTLRNYRRHLTEQYALSIADRDSMHVAELEDKANTLEKDLARTVVGFGDALRQVDWHEVQAVLQPGEAAIEFTHYQYQNIRGQPTDSIMYAAIVLLPGNGSPSFISLFEERELSRLLQGASGGNYRKINLVYSTGDKGKKNLYELVWQKIETSLKGVNKVYCSLSGLLYRLNIGAIPLSAKETFADRRQLVVLGSTRQLVIQQRSTGYNKEALLIGGVNYTENNAAIAPASPQLSRSRGLPDAESFGFEADSLPRSDSWGSLPGSLAEVLALRPILQSAGIQVKLDTASAATEESIKQNSDPDGQLSPRVLHFATHGYFFPDPNKDSAPEAIAFKTSKNPLLRSGLILAGAQEIWTTGKRLPGREDGVLTALEISLMNLSGTELVVLSACETGLGDIDGNEGVYGLQRAFKIAGAKYIVMSLWKVNDQTTNEFMTDFYAQWLQKGMSIPEAFRKAQHDLRMKYPDQAYHWAGFVLVE